MPNTTPLFTIHPISQKKLFTEDEAYQGLSLMLSMASRTKIKVDALAQHLEFTKNNTKRHQELEQQINQLIKSLHNKFLRIGAYPTARYEAIFPGYEGDFHWTFPEDKLKKVNLKS